MALFSAAANCCALPHALQDHLMRADDYSRRMKTLLAEYDDELAAFRQAVASSGAGENWGPKSCATSAMDLPQEASDDHALWSAVPSNPLVACNRTHCVTAGPLVDIVNSFPPEPLTREVQIEPWVEWLTVVLDDPGSSAGADTLKLIQRGSNSIMAQRVDAMNTIWSYLVTRPTSKRRVVWDMMSLLALIFDFVTLPLMVFEFEEQSLPMMVFEFGRIATTVFWSLDLPLCFLAGFNRHGKIIVSPSAIAKKYLISWFVPDLLIVSFDWWSYSSGVVKEIDFARLGKAFRISRVLRVIRLMRIVKQLFAFDQVFSFGDLPVSDNVTAIFKVFKLLSIVIFLVHFLACGWYLVGYSCIGVYDKTWLQSGPQDLVADQAGFLVLYTLSFHWTIAQFTPAPFNYHPANLRERAYAVASLFIGFVTFASFVASITATMTALRANNIEKIRRTEMVQRFLEENQISIEVADRVTVFLSQQLTRKSHLMESQVPALKALPESLLRLLHRQVYDKVLVRHPLFNQLQEVGAYSLSSICHHTMSMKVVKKSEELFNFGEKAHSMHFIVFGAFEYFRGNQESAPIIVEHAGWISELILWVSWVHRGRLAALKDADLMSIDAKNFRLLAHPPEVAKMFRAYAVLFALRKLTDTVEVEDAIDDVQELVHKSWEGLGRSESGS